MRRCRINTEDGDNTALRNYDIQPPHYKAAANQKTSHSVLNAVKTLSFAVLEFVIESVRKFAKNLPPSESTRFSREH
jgi:hypothetical protein